VLRKLGLAEGGEPDELPEENLRAEIPQPPLPGCLATDEETARGVPAAAPAATSSEPALDDETQKFIAQSLTDVDLFASYGLTQKAIGLLEAILRRAPRHTPTLEKLLDFVLGAGDGPPAPPNSPRSWNKSMAKLATSAAPNVSENCAAASSVPLV